MRLPVEQDAGTRPYRPDIRNPSGYVCIYCGYREALISSSMRNVPRPYRFRPARR